MAVLVVLPMRGGRREVSEVGPGAHGTAMHPSKRPQRHEEGTHQFAMIRRRFYQWGLPLLEALGLGFRAHARLVCALRATFKAEGFVWDGWLPWTMEMGGYTREDLPGALLVGPHWVNGTIRAVDMAATQTLWHLWCEIVRYRGLGGYVAYRREFRLLGSNRCAGCSDETADNIGTETARDKPRERTSPR